MALLARSEADLQQAAAEVEAVGQRVVVLPLDVSREDQVMEAVNE